MTFNEFPRTYEVTTVSGGIIFKLMKPSEMQKISGNMEMRKKLGWASIKSVGTNRKDGDILPKPRVQRDRPDWGFLTGYNTERRHN